MPEDIDRKIEQILSELPEDKRKILRDHIDELEGKEKEDFLVEVVTEYEALKSNSIVSFTEVARSLDTTDNSTAKDSGTKEISTVDESEEESLPFLEKVPSPKTEAHDYVERKKKPVAAIIICSLLGLIAIGSVLYFFVLSENPSFQAFTSKLGITPVVTTSESTEVTTTETTPLPTPTPEPTAVPTPTPIPAPTATPTPTPIPLKENAPNLKGVKVVIDPGHQEKTDYKKEQFKKGTTNGKPRSTSGAVGIVTGQKEYAVTLDTALMLKEYLEKCGATVVLTRTENNVNISNKERAALAVKAKPTLFIRLHADDSTNASVKGVRVYIPSSGKLNKKADADRLGKLVASAGKTTFRGSKATNQYTGLNFASSIRSYQIVLGYLSNKDDDERLADADNRYEMCAAIATFCKSVK